MIEALFLNYMIQHQDIGLAVTNNIDGSYFQGWPEVFEYITNHRVEYGTVPSIDIVKSKFKDFEHFEVTDSPAFLVEEIRTQKMQYEFFETLKCINGDLKDGKTIQEVIDMAQGSLYKIKNQFQVNKYHDTVKDADERLEEHERRSQIKGLIGLTWGLPTLDEYTLGILGGDVNTITGVQGEGKSWLRKFIGVNAWYYNKAKVLDISLEMNPLVEDWRWDVIAQNLFYEEYNLPFNNVDLQSGKANQDRYKEYIEMIKKQHPYILYTRKTKMKFNHLTIRELIYQHQPDLILLDHVALVDSTGGTSKKGNDQYERIATFSRGIKEIVEETGICYVQLAQADQNVVKKAKGEVKNPKKTDLKYANAISEDSSRIITLKQDNGIMNVLLDKNRHGREGLELPLIWRVNEGIIKEVGVGVNAF